MYGSRLDITEIELNVMPSQRLSGWTENVNQRYRSIAYEGRNMNQIEKRNMNQIQKLKRSINRKCVSEDYEQVNECINEIICDEQKVPDIKEIKAMICQLEGQGNQTIAYTVMSICYSFFAGVISTINIVGNEESAFLSIILLFVVVALVPLSIIIKHKDYKEAFILKALNFKLEELNNKNPSVKNDLTEKTEPGLK